MNLDTLPKTLIALYHKASRGKTETLRALGRLLLEQYPGAPAGAQHSTVPEWGDFRLELVIGSRGVLVESLGDPGYDLHGRLDRPFANVTGMRPHLVFCATRTRGDTVNEVAAFAEAGDYEIIWTSTYQADGQPGLHSALNALKARHLLDMVQTLAATGR